jgi:hypothetical protein
VAIRAGHNIARRVHDSECSGYAELGRTESEWQAKPIGFGPVVLSFILDRHLDIKVGNARTKGHAKRRCREMIVQISRHLQNADQRFTSFVEVDGAVRA